MKRRFYIQVTVVLLSAICLSSLYYYEVCKSLRVTKEGVPGKLNHILYDTSHYDVLFAGSSRVSRNIDPLLFTSRTGLRSYNAGIDGAGLTTTSLLIRKFIHRHGAVRYVFINLDTYTLENDSSIFYFSLYYPYLADDDVYTLSKVEKPLRIGRYAPFVAVSYIDDHLKGVAADGYAGIWPTGDTVYQQQGFEPINSEDYKGTSDTFTLSFHYDEGNIKKLDELCHFLVQSGCRVCFMMAPIYGSIDRRTENTTTYYTKLHTIESKYSVMELNYYADLHFAKEHFYNHTHLNHGGADMYTRLLADTLLQIQDVKVLNSASPSP